MTSSATTEVPRPFRITSTHLCSGGCFDHEFSTWSNALSATFVRGRLIPLLSDITAAEVEDAP